MIASAAVLLIPLAAESIGFDALTPFTLLPIQNGTVNTLGAYPAFWLGFLMFVLVFALLAIYVRVSFAKEVPLVLRIAKKLAKKLRRKIFPKLKEKKLQSPRA